MYVALWNWLPGRRVAKTAWMLLLFLAVVAVLYLWIFPAIAPLLPYEDVTVQSPVPTSQMPSPSTGAPRL